MKPEDVPAEIVAAAAMALAFHPNAFLVDPDGTALRTLLAAVLPDHERRVREQVAAEIEAVADRDGDGSPWDHGMGRAAEIARGPQPVTTIGGIPADQTCYPADLEAVRRPQGTPTSTRQILAALAADDIEAGTYGEPAPGMAQDAPTAPAQPATAPTGDTEATGSAGGGTGEMSALHHRIADALTQWVLLVATGRPDAHPPHDRALRENSLARAGVVMDVIRPVLERLDAELAKTRADLDGALADLNEALDHNDRTCEAVAERDRLAAALERGRALARQWSALAPADDQGEDLAAALTADHGRALLAALDPAQDGQ